MSFFADFPKGPEERVASQEVVETMRSDDLPREQTETARLHLITERWDGIYSYCMCPFL